MSNAVETTHAEPALLSHFDDRQQQDDSTKFGMWTFLSTEVMFSDVHLHPVPMEIPRRIRRGQQ